MNIRKGDIVKILAGKDRGKTGKVLTSMPAEEKVVIEGLNTVNKRSRPKKQGETGQIVSVPRPIPASRVMLVCGNCKNPTRVGFRKEGEKMVRYCKKCQATT